MQPLPRPDASSRWVPRLPVEPRATLSPLQHGPSDPTFVWVPGGAWRAVRLASGEAAVLLHWGPRRMVRPERHEEISAMAWGPGAEQAVREAPLWLGERDDWEPFDSPAFSSTLPASVAATRRARPGLLLPAGGSLFDTLAAIILEQRVTGLEAHFAWSRLVKERGERVGEHLHPALFYPPLPGAWRSIPSWEWHRARVDASRRDALVSAAERASALQRLEARSPAEIERGLRSLPGIGVWTAAETLQRTHGAPDHVSFGDFHVAHFVGQALTGRRADDAGMQALLAPWSGHRQRVVRLLMASGAKNPSYGPRLAPQDHRGH